MGALGTLGVGLSVLFGIFLAVLAGEIYYMMCCRRGGSRTRAGGSSRRVSSVQVVEEQAAAAAATEMGGFACEAALVGSFGGYPGAPLQSDFMSKFFPASSQLDEDLCVPHNFLFPIAEETKEEMELHAGTPPRKLPVGAVETPPLLAAAPPALPCPSVTLSVTEPSVCASSTSVSFSVTPDATPFATPPSSPSSSDTSSDRSLPSPAESLATAASRFSTHSYSPASASSSPAGAAASRFSVYSQSPSSVTASPATANAGLPANSLGNMAGALPGPQHSSPGDGTCRLGDHGSLGALFRRQQQQQHYNNHNMHYSPSRYSPLRPVAWPGHITDFRHALPFSPPPSSYHQQQQQQQQ